MVLETIIGSHVRLLLLSAVSQVPGDRLAVHKNQLQIILENYASKVIGRTITQLQDRELHALVA